MQPKKERFFEIDLFRGIGIAMMLVFHLFFDLDYLGLLNNEMYKGYWLVFQRTTASILILVFGVSLAVSYERARQDPEANMLIKYATRAIALFAIALGISLATWIYPHEGFIIFGIIHFLAVSVLVGYFFMKFFYLNLVAGIAVILAGLEISGINVGTNLLVWLGLSYPGVYSLDYFPVFPWFGIVLIGIFIGKLLYAKKLMKMPTIPENRFTRCFSFLGKNALAIYLAHQPVLFGILLLYLKLKTFS